MHFVALLVCIPLIAFVSLSVFGGGQIFMPIFNWLWTSLGSWFGIKIPEELINNVFAISNSTPGILSPKFATITGYMVAEGQWWGFIAMFITYLAFVLPAILMMKLALKYSDKFHDAKYFKNLIRIMNPVVTAIIFALVIQLFIGLIAPNLVFNKSAQEYISTTNSSPKSIFFSGWRLYALWCYVPSGIAISLYLYNKKIPMLGLILANVLVALVIFQPWLK
ncbi:Chromate transport protein [Mycoplasmopsis bovigenitalium 51080]|uniref:Chromate transport protein n=1 Tax=Mycoplasmopsis bovigenitalium 51080 TaxID=1188235 RepID=N9TSJ6_9BACT|nr:chromate transporter [Mycoplasmopsis bovigenitalium]ENY69060.1 Chromate transport protein [Mycoplasmopsis bovigenitalium 51080]